MTEQTNWVGFVGEVEAGNLYLEADVARKCARHCADLIDQLDELIRAVGRLGKLDGLGTFPSGIALARKFSEKATGGVYSMDRALADHVAEVDRMRRVFERIGAMYSAADEGAASMISDVGEGVR